MKKIIVLVAILTILLPLAGCSEDNTINECWDVGYIDHSSKSYIVIAKYLAEYNMADAAGSWVETYHKYHEDQNIFPELNNPNHHIERDEKIFTEIIQSLLINGYY